MSEDTTPGSGSGGSTGERREGEETAREQRAIQDQVEQAEKEKKQEQGGGSKGGEGQGAAVIAAVRGGTRSNTPTCRASLMLWGEHGHTPNPASEAMRSLAAIAAEPSREAAEPSERSERCPCPILSPNLAQVVLGANRLQPHFASISDAGEEPGATPPLPQHL